jgi:transcriptional regulator with XRE-family HTH domain
VSTGEKVKELRLQKLWTQRQLAERAGLSLRAVNAIETGKNNPTDLTLTRLARALRVTVDDLQPEPVQPPEAVSA